MSSITIRPVMTKADKLDFLRVPFSVYAKDPNWVAPLFFERMEHLSTQKNPYFQHAEAQLFIAEKNGKPVGRISAQIDRLHLERYNNASGQFGFLDAPDDPEIFKALFQAAESWLKQKGMRQLQGPFSFSINDESGLLVDGFDTPPNMMMGHALPFFAKRTEENGYTKAKDLLAYIHYLKDELPPNLERRYQWATKSGDIEFRPLNKSKMKSEIQIIMSIFNDAWSENWNYVPFTEAELQMLATNLKMLVDKNSVQIAYYKNEPAAFIVAMPNLNEWFSGLQGKLLPRGLPRLIGKLISKRATSFRVPLMGVRQKFHESPIGAALSYGLIKQIYAFHGPRGVKEVELSWILEDNQRIKNLIESIGGKVYKTYRIYEKQL
jgi:hypothetical protein